MKKYFVLITCTSSRDVTVHELDPGNKVESKRGNWTAVCSW